MDRDTPTRWMSSHALLTGRHVLQAWFHEASLGNTESLDLIADEKRFAGTACNDQSDSIFVFDVTCQFRVY